MCAAVRGYERHNDCDGMDAVIDINDTGGEQQYPISFTDVQPCCTSLNAVVSVWICFAAAAAAAAALNVCVKNPCLNDIQILSHVLKVEEDEFLVIDFAKTRNLGAIYETPNKIQGGMTMHRTLQKLQPSVNFTQR